MPAQQQHHVTDAYLASGTVAVGECVVMTSDGRGYVLASAENRALHNRPTAGIALQAGDPENTCFEMQTVGVVPSDITRLGVGAAGYIKVSDAGLLQRTGSWDTTCVGRCDADGTAYVCFSLIGVSLGGGSASVGVSTQVQTSDGAGAFSAPTNVKAAANHLTVGASPSGLGYFGVPYGLNTVILGGKTPGGTDTKWIYIDTASCVTFGTPNGSGMATIVDGGVAALVNVLGLNAVYYDGASQTIRNNFPRTGGVYAWGSSEGEYTETRTGLGPGGAAIPINGQSCTSIIFSGTGTASFAFDTPPDNSHSYFKFIEETGGTNKVIGNSTSLSGTTYTLQANTRVWVKVTPNGVFPAGAAGGGGATPGGSTGDLQINNAGALGAVLRADNSAPQEGDVFRRRSSKAVAEAAVEVPSGSNNDLIGLDGIGGIKNIQPASMAAGDILYHDGTKLVRLAASGIPDGYVLTKVAGVPAWSPASGGGSGPTAVSLNYTLTDIAGGGQSIVLTGTNLSSATSLTVGGTSATITGNTSSAVTFTAPAKAAGSYDVTVTTAGGSSTLSAALEYWTPGQITGIDEYYDANKGTTSSGGLVSAWSGQKNSVSCSQSTGANKPSLVSSVFGNLPAIRFAKENWLSAASGRLLASGASFFAVAKWTDTDATPSASAINVPLTIVGWSNASAWGAFGCSNDQIAYKMFNEAGSATSNTLRGTSLNDGVARLFGVTHDTSQNVKAYLGTTQQGSTQVFTAAYPASFLKWADLGNGYLSGDGFAGDLGAIIIVAGVISGTDLTRLNKWAQQRFGTP